MVFGVAVYPLSVAIGVVGAVAISVYLVGSHLKRAEIWWCIGALLLIDVFSLLGAKLHAMLEAGSWELVSRFGFRYPGGIVGALVGGGLLAWFGRRRTLLLRVGDLIAPSASFAMVIVRLGCLLAGCCHGTPSDLPWAVAFPQDSYAWRWHVDHALLSPDSPVSLAVHPLQLYLAAWAAFTGVIGWRMLRISLPAGQVLFSYVALDNLGKAFLESLRDPPVPALRWASLLLAALAMLALAWNAGLLQSARPHGRSPAAVQ
jgi:phosphatidylglycerol:prolipoprotein diacylglycerol transferase